MTESGEPPAETRQAIMEATYRAMRAHGYADLTMSAIAAEFEKSQSLLHYHYDTKEDLLVAFLEYLIDGFVGKVESGEVDGDGAGGRADGTRTAGTPRETLDAVVDALLYGPDDWEDFSVAMLELRAQVPHSEAYRDQFVRNDDHLRALLAGLVEACVDAGEVGDVDPEATARRIMVALEGARSRWLVLGDEAELRLGRAMIDDLLGATAEAAA